MLLAALWLLVVVTPHAQAASEETTEECAYRVIRDWYSGGRVDGVYPLRCYRAAIQALPEDVLQYSDADRDIQRALDLARQARSRGSEPRAGGAAEERTPFASTPSPPARTPPARGSPAQAAGKPGAAPAPPPATVPTESIETPARLASGPAPETTGGPLPYPVIVLGALAGVLLASGAAGWAASRRR